MRVGTRTKTVISVATSASLLAGLTLVASSDRVDGTDVVQAAIREAASVTPSIPIPQGRAGGTISPYLFGMHQLHSTTTWPSVPLRSFRLWDTQTTWSVLQPTPTTWNWERLDRTVELARSNGADVLMTLGITPRWASARPHEIHSPYGPGAAAEPKDMRLWRAYVKKVATRYKGRIRHYQVWNEVNWKEHYSGSPRALATMTRITYHTIKSVDSGATIISPAFVPRDGYNDAKMREYFRGGTAAYLDIMSLHLYAGDPEASMSYLRHVRTVLKQLNVRKPVWNTELTYGRKRTNDVYSERRAAGVVTRAYLLAPSNAVRRLYWYAWDDWDFGGALLTTRAGRPTRAATAYREVQSWMVGSRDRGCASRGVVWSCRFDLRTGGSGLAVWARTSAPTVRIPPGYRRMRLLDGSRAAVRPGAKLRLSGQPVLLTTR